MISAGVPRQQEAARLGTDMTIAGVPVRPAPPDHVVALKIIAGRPRDRRDVEEIHEEWPGLEVAKVNALLAPFGEVWTP